VFVRKLVVFVGLVFATPLQAAWHKSVSDNFIIYGDLEEPKLRSFARDVERFAAVLRLQKNVEPDPDARKLTIFVVSGQEAVRKVLGGGEGVAGFYTSNITGAYAVVPRALAGRGGKFALDPQTVLFHEYAHHFMLQHFPGAYSPWYIEGFAEFYSTVAFRNDGAVELGLPALHRAYSLDKSDLFPLNRMLATDTGTMTSDETERFYAWAWLLTHYLTFDKTRAGQLTKYLKAFTRGANAETAAADAFGDLGALQRDLVTYRIAAARRILSMVARGMKIAEPNIRITPLDAADSASMPLFMRFVQGTRSKEEVASFAESARKLVTRFPGQATPLELLAEGELDAEQFDAATRANDALLALRSDDARALLRSARIAAAQMTKSSYPGGWAAVRKLIVRANRAAPNDPFPLYVYFDSFRSEGVTPPEIAFDGIRRALELAPQEGGLRGIVAARLIADGKRDEARIVLAPLLNDPHSADVRERARAMLDPSPAPPKTKDGTETTKPKSMVSPSH
jgi:hypothetical protein